MSNIIMYHNPKCGTSRNVLGFIKEAGHEPIVIEYLKTPPTREKLVELVAKMGIPLKKLVRVNNNEENPIVKALEVISEEVLLDAMVSEPILINRPIVVIGEKAMLCRPSESVKGFLEEMNNG